MWCSQWYKFQSSMMIHFWENTFWAKTSLSFVFRGWNLVYPEVLRCDDHNCTSFKAVWSSTSEKNTFWAKTSLSFIVRTLSSLWGFQPCQLQWYSFKAVWWSVSKNNTFWAKTSLFIVFKVPNSVYPEVFRSEDHNGTGFKAVWWTVSEKKHFLS